MRILVRLFVLCLALSTAPSFAAVVANLYQVREPVASQTPEERDAALVRAFDTLVQRLTGDAGAAQSQALAGLRAEPQQVISQYGYEGQEIVVDFDPATTERSLRQAGLALWGANRPAILAWWLNNSLEGSSLVGDGQPSADPLQRAAQRRGLPLRLPLADLGEQLLGTSDNLTASQPDAGLLESVERYGADALLAVDAQEQDGQWQASWQLWLGDSREQGTVKAGDEQGLADAVMLAVGERLAPRFAASPSAASHLTLQVQGADLARYAELSRLLEPFDAHLQLVEGDTLVFRVNASPEQLRAQLSLARLEEMPAPQAQAPQDEPGVAQPAPALVPRGDRLYFHW